jgi:hypothetical protein
MKQAGQVVHFRQEFFQGFQLHKTTNKQKLTA